MARSLPSFRRNVVVFSGDSVKTSFMKSAESIEAARLIWRPPAGLGDLWRHVRADVSAMVLVDCRRGDGPSVWHREIRSVIERGIAVLGAGGIGALRAAEMNGTGMTGVGWVYDRVDSGLIQADDEVLPGPDGFTLAALRAALEDATARKIVTSDEAGALLARGRECRFSERTRQQAERWLEKTLPPVRRSALVSFLHRNGADPRRRDAALAINRALSGPPAPASPPADTPAAAMLKPKWQLSEIGHRPFVVNGKTVYGDAVLEAAGALAAEWMPRLINDFFVERWLSENNVLPPKTEITAFVDGAASDREADLEGFLLENALTPPEWRGLLERQAAVAWATAQPDLPPARDAEIYPFAGAWVREHGAAPPPDSGLSPGAWAVEKGPGFFGMVWEPMTALFDALRLSGRASHLAATVVEKEGP